MNKYSKQKLNKHNKKYSQTNEPYMNFGQGCTVFML